MSNEDQNRRRSTGREASAHKRIFMRRLWRFLYGIEEILQAIFGDMQTYQNFCQSVSDRGGLVFDVKVRRWHPAFWVGFFRCRVLGDKFGSGLYALKESPRSG